MIYASVHFQALPHSFVIAIPERVPTCTLIKICFLLNHCIHPSIFCITYSTQGAWRLYQGFWTHGRERHWTGCHLIAEHNKAQTHIPIYTQREIYRCHSTYKTCLWGRNQSMKRKTLKHRKNMLKRESIPNHGGVSQMC